MRLRTAHASAESRDWSPEIMRDELAHALTEALFELEVLPKDGDGAVVGLYAVMDDVTNAIHRTEALDLRHSA